MEPEGILVLVLWFAGIGLLIGVVSFAIWFTVFRRVGQKLPGRNTHAKDSPFRPVDLAQAINAYVTEYEDTFGEDPAIDKAVDGADLVYIRSETPTRSFEVNHRGKLSKVHGITDSLKRVRMAWLPGDGIGNGATFHELTHLVLWVLTGEPDPDHEEDKYKGWTDEHNAMIGRLKKRFLETKTLQAATLGLAIAKALQPLSILGVEQDEVIHCGTCSRESERIETEEEEKRRVRREKKALKRRAIAGGVTWDSSRMGVLDKEKFDVEGQRAAVTERYINDLVDDLTACLRQTVSVACTELAQESWKEVLRWQRIGEAVLDVMATLDNDPVRWRKLIGGPEEYKSELKRVSFGLAALSFRPEGVTVPMLHDMQFTVEVPHPKAPVS